MDETFTPPWGDIEAGSPAATEVEPRMTREAREIFVDELHARMDAGQSPEELMAWAHGFDKRFQKAAQEALDARKGIEKYGILPVD